MEHVAGKDRLVEDEPLVDLDDLHRLVAGIDFPHEVRLDQLPEDRDESRRRDDGVIPECGGRVFIQRGRVVGLDRLGEFADFLPAHLVAVRVLPRHPVDVGIDRHRYANFADATARPKIFLPPAVAVMAIVTDLLSGSSDLTRPVNTISAPLPS